MSFWGECVLTAVHIMNRLPNAALQFKVPYEVLTKKEVNYNDLKAFGCLAVAYNNTHKGDKFAPRGIPSVFIGYPSMTKGYKLLNFQNMQTFVSRHVVFHEGVFPLNKNDAEQYLKPLPLKLAPPVSGVYEDDIENEVQEEDESNDDMVEVTQQEGVAENEEAVENEPPRRSTRTSK